ncbi:MAG: glutamine amidotransferase, partial [Nitrospinota bacterium]
EVRGYTGKNLPVVLALEGQVLATQAVDVDRQPFRKVLSFRFVPSEVGSFRLSVSTPPQADEHLLHNNRKEQVLEVRRDKIRVLALSGAPSWNYRFLRMALKQDPVVDLVSLIFLRSPSDDPGAASHELSLIPFPLETIFLRELKNFDLVIFDNFTYRHYFSWLYLDQVKSYVEKGGGFAMIGGRHAFGAGGYMESPLAEVLPVAVSARGGYRRGVLLKAHLTPVGEAHPITRLAQDSEENRRLWRGLPPIEGVNEETAAPQGEVLLTAGEKGQRPLLVVGRYEQGRTLALLTDDLWRWNFALVGKRGGNRLHLQLVRQMVRWLVNEPGMGQVLVLEGGVRKRWQDPFTIRLQVLDNSYRPARGAAVRVELVGPQGQRLPLEARYEPAAKEFRATFRPQADGLHRVVAEAHLGGKLLGRQSRAFAVAPEALESEVGLPRWQFLREAARATGGVFFPAERADEKAVESIARAVEARLPTQVIEERQVRLWSTPFGALAIILLLTFEWTLRRLWGLA